MDQSYKKDWRPHTVVEDGAIYIHNIEKVEHLTPAFAKEMQPKAEEPVASPQVQASDSGHLPVNFVTPLDRIKNGIQAVATSGKIENDYEYAAVMKYIDELQVLGKLGYADFEQILAGSGAFTEGKVPKASNISKIEIKGTFPNWVVKDKKYTVAQKFFDVVKEFIKGYNKD